MSACREQSMNRWVHSGASWLGRASQLDSVVGLWCSGLREEMILVAGEINDTVPSGLLEPCSA
eukprot:7031636-Ditylum_brightwellii.AAC.1